MTALVAWPDGKLNLSTDLNVACWSSMLYAGRLLRVNALVTATMTMSMINPNSKLIKTELLVR